MLDTVLGAFRDPLFGRRNRLLALVLGVLLLVGIGAAWWVVPSAFILVIAIASIMAFTWGGFFIALRPPDQPVVRPDPSRRSGRGRR